MEAVKERERSKGRATKAGGEERRKKGVERDKGLSLVTKSSLIFIS